MLSDSTVLIKTEQGRNVIRERLPVVRTSERAMLVLVDGKSTVSQLRSFLAFAKAESNTFDDLLAKGLVEVTQRLPRREPKTVSPDFAADRFNELYEMMVALTSSFLGLRGYFVQLRIERCASLAELESLRPELIRAIAARHGADIGRSVDERLDTN